MAYQNYLCKRKMSIWCSFENWKANKKYKIGREVQTNYCFRGNEKSGKKAAPVFFISKIVENEAILIKNLFGVIFMVLFKFQH